MRFSAGGHLAACLGMMWNRDFLYGPLNMAPEDIQPKGMILCYPVITSGEFGHKRSFEQLLGGKAGDPRLRELVSLELQAGPHTPRTFLWHTWTDQSVPAENSLLLAQALKKAGVSWKCIFIPADATDCPWLRRRFPTAPETALCLTVRLDGTGKRMDKRKGQGMIC